MKVRLTIAVPHWLQNIILWPILQYHRLRYGPSARFIYVGRLKFTIVDANLYDRLRWYNWRLNRSGRNWYVETLAYRGPGLPPKRIWLHHIVRTPPPGFLIDHQNHNGLDNRLANLRVATTAENAHNKRKQTPKSTSKYKGVDYVKSTGKYRARIALEDGSRPFLGSFTNEIDAAKAYDLAAKLYFGKFACLNFDK